MYVCRARHNGVWVSGQLRSKYKECIVSLHSSVHKYFKFEVLQNLDGGAMLSWMPWDKFATIPKGAVAGGQDTYVNYVARKKVAQDEGISFGYTYLIGKFNPRDGLGKITVIDEHDKEISYLEGEILVETEPTHYELTGVKFNLYRKRATRDPRFLAETILRNGAASDAIKVDSALAYNYTYTLYWGHGHAILTGLNTTVRLTNGTVLDNYKWGIVTKEEREDVFKVERVLEPGTACNVTLRGNYTDMDVPYTATLVAYYPDGKTKSRIIHGNKVEVGMMDVTPDYGDIYYLRNNSLVPTTTTTTTTSTTTTSTSTTEAPILSADIPLNEVIQIKKKVDTESTPSKNKGESQSMMSDESGDALSLKKKEDQIKQAGVVGSSAAIHAPAASVLMLALSTVVRQRLIM